MTTAPRLQELWNLNDGQKKRVSRTDFFEAISKSYLCFLVVKNCVFENIKHSVHLCVLDLLRIQNTDISESLCCAQTPKKFEFHNINISDGQRIIMLSLYTEQPFYIFNPTDEVTPHLQILIKPTSSIQPGKHMFRTPGVHIRYSLESISASDIFFHSSNSRRPHAMMHLSLSFQN